jgi:hypothetical protein
MIGESGRPEAEKEKGVRILAMFLHFADEGLITGAGDRLCVERELSCVHWEECKVAGISCPCPDCRPMPARLLLGGDHA